MLKKLAVLVAVILSVTLSGCGPAAEPVTVEETGATPVAGTEAPEPTAAPTTPPPDPVTLDLYDRSSPSTFDPQVAVGEGSIDHVENLFVQLTNYERDTLEIVPEAATSWEISDDGLTYTFKLRTDIPWVHHDPETGQTVQVVDEAGEPRFVTAHDFVYGIKRACDPKIGSYYSDIVAPFIKGCEEVLYADDPENIPPELVEAIAVSAPADDTLVIELPFPASYFESMTPLWTLGATPQWTIEEHGDAWIEPGKIVTNGRYVLHELQPGVRCSTWRNPLLREDLRGRGNIERVVHTVVPDNVTGYALWLKNEVDTAFMPRGELQAHLERFPDETIVGKGLATTWLQFGREKPPFDDARVRRAFSAAIDRQTLCQDVHQGQGIPMIHLAPPGVFGAPPIDEVGVGFDPEYARGQMAEAGYPDCQGFPPVTLMESPGPNRLQFAEFLQGQWEEHLGCDLALVQIEQLPSNERWNAIEGPAETRPHLWRAGWAADYPDENNFVGDVLWCARGERECTHLDDLIVEAREEQDPQRRIELFRQIEEGFFGPEGEMPIAPLFQSAGYGALHSWLDQWPNELLGGDQWYNYTIDWEAKQEAQGR